MSIADFVEQTTSTTGTGTLSLDGEVAQRRTFVQGFGTGAGAIYILEQGENREIGAGVVSAGTPDTLTRSLIWSTTGSLLNLTAGTKRVYNAPPSDVVRFGGVALPAAGGTANALTLAHTPPVRALRAGQVFRTVLSSTNTGAVTLDVDGLGAQPVHMPSGSALPAGALLEGAVVELVWRGAAFQLLAGGQVVQSLNGGPLAGFRNLLINGNPFLNQRGYVSGAATSGANQYTLDRWRVVTSGQNLSWTDSAGVRTCTAPAGGVEQVVEATNNLGGQHTLSWTGTATATVGGTSVANGGQVTLTANTDVTVRFSGGTFALAQLEPGGAATPFERRPAQIELTLAERYFKRLHWAVDFHAGAGGQIGAATLRLGMRVTPTLAVAAVVAELNATSSGFSTGSTAANSERAWFQTQSIAAGRAFYYGRGSADAEI
jgi:hypothetical protein